jgi:AraC family transcriptional regulator of arabinose operon
MSKFNILGVSHQKREPANFHWLRENGLPAILFLHFIVPAVVILDEVSHIVEKSGCILYTPGHRQEYKAHNGKFKNDYLTIQVDVPDFLARFGLPENEIFYIRNGDEITHKLEWIAWAVVDKTEPHGQDIDDAIIDLFTTLARLRIVNDPNFNRTMATKQRFIVLRDEMRQNPRQWNVEKMSQKVWLTRSRFSVLYNEFFGISPNADLINFKLEHAKHLLTTTKEPISAVANMCGHTSVEHFTRVFAKTVGETPLQYRKNKKNVI